MLAKIMITCIGLLHIYILILEMFLWDRPLGIINTDDFVLIKDRA